MALEIIPHERRGVSGKVWALDTGVGQGDVVRGARTGGEGAGEQEEEFGER